MYIYMYTTLLYVYIKVHANMYYVHVELHVYEHVILFLLFCVCLFLVGYLFIYGSFLSPFPFSFFPFSFSGVL